MEGCETVSRVWRRLAGILVRALDPQEGLNQRPVLLLAKYFLPALVRRPFIAALPIDIFLIRETLRKIA
jgi:hypothetical protein